MWLIQNTSVRVWNLVLLVRELEFEFKLGNLLSIFVGLVVFLVILESSWGVFTVPMFSSFKLEFTLIYLLHYDAIMLPTALRCYYVTYYITMLLFTYYIMMLLFTILHYDALKYRPKLQWSYIPTAFRTGRVPGETIVVSRERTERSRPIPSFRKKTNS